MEGRNLRIGGGELDLVVTIGGSRVAVEVKTVRGDAEPLDGFDVAKQRQVWELASAAGCHRVDVIGVRVSEAVAEIRWLPAID